MRNKLLKRPASALALTEEPNVRQLRSRSVLIHQPPASVGVARSSSKPTAAACIASRPSPLLMLKNVAEGWAVDQTIVQIERGIAVPTSEWRVVPKGVPCPPGCEYRMDMATGVNWVRRLQAETNVTRGGSNCSAVVVSPTSCATPSRGCHRHEHTQPEQTSLLKRNRQQPQSSGLKSKPVRTLAVVDLSTRASNLVAQKTSQSPRRKPKFKSVHSEHTQRKASFSKDGSRKDSNEAVKSRSVTCRDLASGGLIGEKITSRKKSSVRRLADGRAVVVQTVTVQKTTYLPRGSQRA
eukprot:TRINITY_DN102989_c0_g1_i1.p1 TRINITY_DN102989_c0_g1~~TRINITY_DN102989_c0_g1_i1.p1  ORF type:complete len:295 (-),score=18.76 TRINITY_DN102989_c0_g1_i1:138-1022(-)